jgi:hypothetical protein
MPKNLVRYQKCGVFHFITFNCYRREPLLSNSTAYRMHRNPVKRGLVSEPQEWPWSSFLHYATGKLGNVEIESEWTALRREMQFGTMHYVLLPTLRKKTRSMGHPQCQDAERVSHPPMNYARTSVGEQRGDIWE